MADINNFSEINDNFDTIKTLLNSIRAQGILNTSDVDKLLAGINSKLEKINTEEDIDLIKAFLSELKQNLDERHSVLISKFGAIESLFANLLKNSSETLKSSEVKELFDIVATNLSVFSREVVSQKETLTDITLRLDAMRADDSQKKEIIKTISVLNNDVEKINNGFDSIVLSLNENFKTVLKTISDIDKTESIAKFEDKIEDMVNSSTTILSAIQLLDKKNSQIEDSLGNLATQNDYTSLKKILAELSAKSQELTNYVDSMVQKSYKIDNLAEKIDASVNIIAGLKALIAEGDNKTEEHIISKLEQLNNDLKFVSEEADFENIKFSLENILKEITQNNTLLLSRIDFSTEEIDKLNSNIEKLDIENYFNNLRQELAINSNAVKDLQSEIKSLDLDCKYQNLTSEISKVGEDVKEHIVIQNDNVVQLVEANIINAFNNISSNAEVLNSRLHETQVSISELCEKNFNEVTEDIKILKEIVTQLDENNMSANNAIFSNITDRLAMFENHFKDSLKTQEDFVNHSSDNLIEQIANIKQLSSDLDYKLDNTIIATSNSKQSIDEFKNSLDNILALDFTTMINDLRADLYASKQDIVNNIETFNNDTSEKISNDLFSKYELTISKLDNVTDEIKSAQTASINAIKPILDNITSSVMDVLSYVSVQKGIDSDNLDLKLKEISENVKENNLSYVESVRDIVEVMKSQIENDLSIISQNSIDKINSLQNTSLKNVDTITNEIKNSYNKLIEVQNNFDEIKEILNVNNLTLSSNLNNAIESSSSIKSDFDTKLASLKNLLLEKINEFKNDFSCENADKISELKFNAENLHSKAIQNSIDLKNDLCAEVEKIIDSLKNEINGLNTHLTETTSNIELLNNNSYNELDNRIISVTSGFDELQRTVNDLSQQTTSSLTSTLGKILENFVSLKTLLNNFDEQSTIKTQQYMEALREDFEAIQGYFENIDKNIDEDLTRQLTIIERNFESLNNMISRVMSKGTETLVSRVNEELNNTSEILGNSVNEKLENYKYFIEDLFNNLKSTNSENNEFLNTKIIEFNNFIETYLDSKNNECSEKLENITEKLKSVINHQFDISEKEYQALVQELADFNQNIKKSNDILVQELNGKIDDITKYIDSCLEIQAQDVNSAVEDVADNIQKIQSDIREFSNEINKKTSSLEENLKEIKDETDSLVNESVSKIINEINVFSNELSEASLDKIKSSVFDLKQHINNISGCSQENVNNKIGIIISKIEEFYKYSEDSFITAKEEIETEIKPQFIEIKDKIQALSEESTISLISEINNSNSSVSEILKNGLVDITSKFDVLNDKLDRDSISQLDRIQEQIKCIADNFNSLICEVKESTKSELSTITNLLLKNNRDTLEDIETIVEDKAKTLTNVVVETSLQNQQSFESLINEIQDNVDSIKQNSVLCKDIVSKLVKEQIDLVINNIEKETDVITGDILEQFAILKDNNKDELMTLANGIEGVIEGYIIDSVNDLKAYIDVKSDSTVYNNKLDNLRADLENSTDGVLENINKLLEVSVFSDSITDLKATNEILITSMAEKLNTQITDFVNQNVTDKLANKLDIFNKIFVDNIVDKYEELKAILVDRANNFDKIGHSIEDILSSFQSVSSDIQNKIEMSLSTINKSIDSLATSFADLKAQILNKSFDEAFQASLNNQVSGIEKLVKEQTGYLEDIEELCGTNLPELTEMNTIVKHSIQNGVQELITKVSDNGENLAQGLKTLKTDIITQFINVFNQISFVTEQEEIIDFIQEKHSELITILSHIVLGAETVNNIDTKVSTIKEDINSLNEKINSIISSQDDVDYIYSLQDLESDIANLRLVLNEIKTDNKSKEFEELFDSTNKIYSLVETIKSELPRFEAEEFKKDFENLAEDIVSISTRTNKLILTSDESYKTLQDNLQDFKLVINDLDERTRNFAQDAGIDKIDDKLASINTMMQNGAKTNIVFNQVFEYLAEWVDKAGEQINSISSKVETLDDIGQIKVMLEDLKAEAEDSSESTELIEALSNVFDKQAKRIASLEAKIDRMIVENTINHKNNKLDLSPMEDTLNRFLVAIDDKISSQQYKINSLEEKLAEMVTLVDNKDTAQLTKKVGGMDRQIAKLNKSIEKIASHVVEK